MPLQVARDVGAAQAFTADSGSQALVVLLHFLGKAVSPAQLRHQFAPTARTSPPATSCAPPSIWT
jgi:hypothetical protein